VSFFDPVAWQACMECGPVGGADGECTPQRDVGSSGLILWSNTQAHVQLALVSDRETRLVQFGAILASDAGNGRPA
jgi:hypothetical protein